MPSLCSTLLLTALAAAASARQAPYLVNISTGKVLPGIGGVGGETDCRRTVNDPSCATNARQLVGARDFAMDPNGRYLFVATAGLDSIGECGEDTCRNVPVHDNSSRLIAYDMKYPQSAPITLSFCGPWQAVEYDAKNQQVVALRHPNLKTNDHGTHIGVEVVAFDAKLPLKPGEDGFSHNCFITLPLDADAKKYTCGCAMGFDPENLNGRVIGRAGLKHDFDLPAATMILLGDSVLVGDQNQHCVVSFPLDGSAGSDKPGTPVAGTCGKTCGQQGCASIGSPSVPAGKLLGSGKNGDGLRYELFKTNDQRLLLQDMNTETIDYGKHPKAETNYQTVPVDPKVSSVYHVPAIDPSSGDLLLLQPYSYDVQRLKYSEKDGYGHGEVVIRKESLEGYFLDISYHGSTVMTPIQGVPVQFGFLPAHASANSEKGPSKSKVLAMVSVAYRQGSEFLDTVFLELDI